MSQEQLLQDLRNLWRDGKHQDFRKKYLLGWFLLTPEDRKNIEDVTGIRIGDRIQEKLIEDTPPLMKKAQEIFGGEITQI